MENQIELNGAVPECASGMDILGGVPPEIFHEIMMYVGPRDLCNALNVCKKWTSMMKSFPWKRKCRMAGYFESEDDLNSKLYRDFIKHFSYWEGIYLYNTKLEENWINQTYREVINQVDKLPGFAIQYFSGDVIIATLGCDEILVLNSTTTLIEKRFCLTFPDGILIRSIRAIGKVENKLIAVIGTATLNESGCFNYPEILFIKVWNIDTKESLLNLQMETIEDHIDKVTIHKDLILVLSHSYAVYIYNMKNNNIECTQQSVSCICFDNEKIAMGCLEGTVVVLDMYYNELMTLPDCDNERAVLKVQMEGKYLISLCQTSTELGLLASIWNIENKSKLYVIDQVFRKCLTMYVNENRLCYVNGFKEGKLIFKLCRLDTGEAILNLVPGYITTHNLFVINRRVGDPFSLQLWSIKTGELIADLTLPKPFSFEFFENEFASKRTKSKFFFVRYDSFATRWSLNVMDFEANIRA